MHKRQAMKAKAKAAPFAGFNGSPERIALLEMMRPQLPWRFRKAVSDQQALADLQGDDEADVAEFAREKALASLGIDPLHFQQAIASLSLSEGPNNV